jgi:mRNA interferase RelE/StbE
LAWTIRFSSGAKKALTKLDKPTARRILTFLSEKLGSAANPREYGKALKGELSDLWRYRVGDYRIICTIEDEQIEILVLRIAHRKEVYKKKG